MEEEAVTLSIQSEKDETSSDKVGMQTSQENFNSDFDDDNDVEGRIIQGLMEEISQLNLEVKKWKNHGERCQEGMVPIFEYRRTIKELREKWA